MLYVLKWFTLLTLREQENKLFSSKRFDIIAESLSTLHLTPNTRYISALYCGWFIYLLVNWGYFWLIITTILVFIYHLHCSAQSQFTMSKYIVLPYPTHLNDFYLNWRGVGQPNYDALSCVVLNWALNFSSLIVMPKGGLEGVLFISGTLIGLYCHSLRRSRSELWFKLVSHSHVAVFLNENILIIPLQVCMSVFIWYWRWSCSNLEYLVSW